MNMKKRISVALLLLATPLFVRAQDNGPASTGTVRGGYVYQQSVEFGSRFTGVDGNVQLYDTLVNLRTGPRLFGQDLSIRPLAHGGGAFDNLYLSSFGFGGDPNDMARLRIEKSKWYNFVGLYRRDVNFFDFNVFANPLNLNGGIGAALRSTNFTPTSMPWFQNSPHLQDMTRNMGDFSLTLFPQSVVRVRLGYARNVNAGRLDTTLESPIRSLLTEHNQWRSDRYQFGIDVRVLKRTTISFDQFFEHDKVDPNFRDNNLSFFDTRTGTPVDLGLLFPPSGCAIVPGVTFPGFNAFVPSAGCNIGLLSYGRSGNVRTDIPTSQLALQSNYIRRLDVTASGTYSSGHSDFLNYQEFSNGFGAASPSFIAATSHTDRVSANADLGLTYHFTPGWSLSDKFRWLNWRDPGDSNQLGFTCTATGAAGLTLAGAGCTVPNAGNTNFYQTYIAEQTFYNTTKLRWDSHRLTAYVGYRYGRRELTGDPSGDSTFLNSYYLVTNGAPDAPKNTQKINEHTGLGEVAIRPTDAWRITADVEWLSADNFFTNISPRHQQRFRINTVYKINRWSSINGGIHFVESRNDFAKNINSTSTVLPPFNPANPNLFPTTGASTVPPAYGHKDHWRYYTFGASLNPNQRFGLDFGWTYLDQLINSATCVPVQLNVIAQAVSAFCVNANSTPPATPASTADVPLVLNYQERTNTGYALLTFRPVHRVALTAGYQITSTAGYNRWTLPGGADSTGELLVVSDVFGNSPPLAGNPTTPCPVRVSSAVPGGCGFAGPFPDAPLSQALNWQSPTAGVAVDVRKNLTFKSSYSYYDYHEKTPRELPITTLPRNFHASMGTVSLRYAF